MALGAAPWFAAAVTRRALPFDGPSRRAIGIVLSCVAFLMAWAFLSVLGSAEPLRSGRVLATLAAGIATFFLVAGTVTGARLGPMVGGLCAALALTCAVSMLSYAVPPLRELTFEGGDRASGFFKNPNQFGMAISTVLPAATAAFLGGLGRRISWGACVVALFLGLLLSGSKANLLLSAANFVLMVCVYAGMASPARRRGLAVASSLLGSLAFLGAGFLLLGIVNPRALTLLQDFASEDAELATLAARSELWGESVATFMRNPVFGQGAGQPLSAGYQTMPVAHSHNVALDYLRTMGAPGFVVLVGMLAVVTALAIGSIILALRSSRAAVRDRILCVGLAVGTLSYLLANVSSDSMGPSTSPFFWSVLYLGLAARMPVRPPIP